ncbi:MAG: hypothetical protein IJ079_10260 [Lachnospiraceae bacterium]|nr:hypothetical protein [Lachnospiraceae bacterium]
MFDSVGNTIFTIVLGVILVYLIIWSVKFISYRLAKKRKENSVTVREKQKSIRHRTIACSKDYWYNIREVEDCPEDEPVERLYHYFETEQECIKALILEMYDCGIVRTEEIEKIAYGEEQPEVKTTTSMFDPYAVDAEYDEFEYDFDEAVEELMLQDDEEVAASAEAADDAEIRAEIYDCWTGYVMQLYDRISVNCNEEMKLHIRNKIMMYGHKEAGILIHSPE